MTIANRFSQTFETAIQPVGQIVEQTQQQTSECT